MAFIDAPLFQYAGVITVSYYLLRLFKYVRRLRNESLWSRTFDFKKFGDWAIVTGASDGIGKAISTELAKCGMNVVLIARTRSKVESFGRELEENYGIQTKALAVDFSDDDHIYDIIGGEIKDLNIALLLNNVGLSNEAVPLMDMPDIQKFSTNICRVNVLAMIKMTQLVLPQMVEKRGGIITNVSSIVGSRVFPYMSLYTATKRCLNTFTASLRKEYSGTGVIVQCLAPGMVSTPMTKVNPSLFVPSAEKFGRYAIKALGKSEYTNTSVWSHNLFQFLTPLFPGSMFASMMKRGADEFLKRKS